MSLQLHTFDGIIVELRFHGDVFLLLHANGDHPKIMNEMEIEINLIIIQFSSNK